MIVGNGQIANAFNSVDSDNVVIFASGVADSSCKNPSEFEKEHDLLRKHLSVVGDRTFVYFSSCALSDPNYSSSEYYQHKLNMEDEIKSATCSYLILRVPQLFSCMKKHNTIINYLYRKIELGEEFVLYNGAYRYVIAISDLVTIAKHLLDAKVKSEIVNIANPYRYSIEELVSELELLTGCNANFKVKHKVDCYNLNLDFIKRFEQENKFDFCFGKKYFFNKMIELGNFSSAKLMQNKQVV